MNVQEHTGNHVDSRLLTPREAALYLRISEGTLRIYASRGVVAKIKVGAKLLFHLDDLNAYIDARRVPAFK